MTGVRSSVAVVTLVVALAAGCRDDGRSLAPAPPVPTSRLTTTTAGPGAARADGELTLTSPAFADGAALDTAHTCDGIDVPPALAITGVPAGTAELAVTVTDRDAGGFVHWVMTGIPPTITVMEPGIVPPGAVTARNDTGRDGWSGPCPPPGEGAHTYEFTVHATAEPIGLVPGTDGRTAVELVRQASVASDVLTATYPSADG